MRSNHRDMALESWIEEVTSVHWPNTTNPYDATPEGRRRRENLRQYLAAFRNAGACRFMMVGEAVGYRGGRMTGVPLTSEAVIQEHPHFRRCFPSLAESYVPCAEDGALRREATAQIVWDVLESVDCVPPPCCWNVVPVHPYDPQAGPWSNRTPTAMEIRQGAPLLRKLIELIKPQTVIAVGKCASRGLAGLGIDHRYVRHPSQGGARLFRAHIAKILTLYSQSGANMYHPSIQPP